MFRLVRVFKLFKKWHTESGFSFAVVEIVRCLGTTLIIVHWVSCFWGYVGVNCPSNGRTWLSVRLEKDNQTLEDISNYQAYNLALCFVMEVITTVGLGDMGPTNDWEVALCTMTMLFTGLTWAWVAATFVTILTNMDPYRMQFNQLMDGLNGVLVSREIPHSLRVRLRKYLYEAYFVHRQRHQQETIKWLSAGLQGELAVESGMDKVCNCVWYLAGITGPVLIDIAQRFESSLFSPNEFIMDKHSLSVVRKGTIFYKGRIILRDGVVGEDMILENEDLRDSACPRVVTFVEVFTLTRKHLGEVCAKHSDFARRIRKAQIKLAIWRGVLRLARAEKIRRNSVGEVIELAVEERLNAQKRRDAGRRSQHSIAGVSKLPGFVSKLSQQGMIFPHQSVKCDEQSDLVTELRTLNQRVADGHLDLKAHLERIERRVELIEGSIKDTEQVKKEERCRNM
jgi:hypothetical protein